MLVASSSLSIGLIATAIYAGLREILPRAGSVVSRDPETEDVVESGSERLVKGALDTLATVLENQPTCVWNVVHAEGRSVSTVDAQISASIVLVVCVCTVVVFTCGVAIGCLCGSGREARREKGARPASASLRLDVGSLEAARRRAREISA